LGGEEEHRSQKWPNLPRNCASMKLNNLEHNEGSRGKGSRRLIKNKGGLSERQTPFGQSVEGGNSKKTASIKREELRRSERSKSSLGKKKGGKLEGMESLIEKDRCGDKGICSSSKRREKMARLDQNSLGRYVEKKTKKGGGTREGGAGSRLRSFENLAQGG